MKKQLISMVVALAILCGLLGIYYLNKNKEVVEEIPEETSEIVLLEKLPEDIEKISFDGHEFQTKNKGDTWELLENPINLDNSKLTGIVSKLSNLKSNQLVKENITDEDKKEFGLDTGKAVKITFTDGSDFEILIGKINPSQEDFFTLINNNVYLIKITDLSAFFDDIELFADLSIILPDMEKINYIEIKSDSKELLIEEDKTAEVGEEEIALIMKKPYEGNVYRYGLDENIIAPISSLKFDGLIWANQKGYVGIPDDQEFDFSNPTLSIKLKDTQGIEQDIIIGGPLEISENVYYAKIKDREEIFAISLGNFEKLINYDVLSIIENFVNLKSIGTVDEINIDYKGEGYNLKINNKTDEESGEETIEPTVNGVSVEEQKFREAYQSIIGISYDSIADESFVIEGNPEISIIFKNLDGTETICKYFNYNDNFYIVEVNGEKMEITAKKNLEALRNAVASLVSE